MEVSQDKLLKTRQADYLRESNPRYIKKKLQEERNESCRLEADELASCVSSRRGLRLWKCHEYHAKLYECEKKFLDKLYQKRRALEIAAETKRLEFKFANQEKYFNDNIVDNISNEKTTTRPMFSYSSKMAQDSRPLKMNHVDEKTLNPLKYIDILTPPCSNEYFELVKMQTKEQGHVALKPAMGKSEVFEMSNRIT